MRYRLGYSVLVALLLMAGAPSRGAEDTLDRMASVNTGLKSYAATMHAHVALRTFPFLSASLDGTYYFKQPDRMRVNFTSGVPVIAEQFHNLYAQVEPPARWRALYEVTVASDDGRTATFHLVPRKHGNVASIDAVADDRTATVTSMRWNYDNGGYAAMQNRYSRIGGYELIVSQTGEVHEPGYSGTIDTTIDDYHLNADVPDAIFANP